MLIIYDFKINNTKSNIRFNNLFNDYGNEKFDNIILHNSTSGNPGNAFLTPTGSVGIIETETEIKNELLFQTLSFQMDELKTNYEKIRKRVINNNEKEINVLRKELNLQKLNKIAQLKKNWIGNEGKVINKNIIKKAREFIISKNIHIQPQIFPSRNGTILFEYQKGDNKFLSIEIFENKFEIFYDFENSENEFTTKIIEEIIPYIDEFRQK